MLFVERYKKVRVGSRIKIKTLYMMFGRRQVPLTFIEWIKRYGNIFTVETIQEFDGSAMLTVEEVKGAVEYDQIITLTRSKRVLNWHRN